MQTTMLIAGGDTRHGDQAVPHRVLELLGSQPNVRMQDVSEWNPDLAEQIAGAGEVVFIDADERLGDPWMEPAGQPSPTTSIVSRARAVFRFSGRAYVCHVPGLDFSRGSSGISPYAESRARKAAALIRRFLEV